MVDISLNRRFWSLKSVASLAETEISTAAVHRLIKKGGAGRIGDDAADELRKVVEEFAVRVGKEALELATHAGRKTVRSEDIRLAVKRVQKD
jgi:histone H3/H4